VVATGAERGAAAGHAHAESLVGDGSNQLFLKVRGHVLGRTVIDHDKVIGLQRLDTGCLDGIGGDVKTCSQEIVEPLGTTLDASSQIEDLDGVLHREHAGDHVVLRAAVVAEEDLDGGGIGDEASLLRLELQRHAMVAIQAEYVGLGNAAFGAGELQAHVRPRTHEVYQQACGLADPQDAASGERDRADVVLRCAEHHRVQGNAASAQGLEGAAPASIGCQPVTEQRDRAAGALRDLQSRQQQRVAQRRVAGGDQRAGQSLSIASADVFVPELVRSAARSRHGDEAGPVLGTELRDHLLQRRSDLWLSGHRAQRAVPHEHLVPDFVGRHAHRLGHGQDDEGQDRGSQQGVPWIPRPARPEPDDRHQQQEPEQLGSEKADHRHRYGIRPVPNRSHSRNSSARIAAASHRERSKPPPASPADAASSSAPLVLQVVTGSSSDAARMVPLASR
jgi:hypothetical protein